MVERGERELTTPSALRPLATSTAPPRARLNLRFALLATHALNHHPLLQHVQEVRCPLPARAMTSPELTPPPATPRFNPKDDVSGQVAVKSSVQRAIRAKLLEQMPLLNEGEGTEEGSLLESIWPKKENLTLVKWYVRPCARRARLSKRRHLWVSRRSSCFLSSRDHISILALNGDPLFFQHFDEHYFPCLRILHRCTRRALSLSLARRPPVASSS